MEVETEPEDPERLRRGREKRKEEGSGLLFAARSRETRPRAPARAGMLRVIVFICVCCVRRYKR